MSLGLLRDARLEGGQRIRSNEAIAASVSACVTLSDMDPTRKGEALRGKSGRSAAIEGVLLASTALGEGRLEEALRLAEDAVAAADRNPETVRLGGGLVVTPRAAARRILASVWLVLGPVATAGPIAEEGARIARGAKDVAEQARCELASASVAYESGDSIAALSHATRARVLSVRAGSTSVRCLALSDASLYLWAAGDGARARDFSDRSLALTPEDSPLDRMRVLLQAARLDAAAGMFARALDRIDDLEAIARHAGLEPGAESTLLRAFVYVDLGALDVARALLARRTLQEAASDRSPVRVRAELLRLRATIACAAGERPETLENLASEGLSMNGVEAPMHAEFDRLRAIALLARGRNEEAERISVKLASFAAKAGRHAFGAQAFGVAARAGHPGAALLRWLGALGLASGGIAARVEYEGLAALASEPEPIGSFARTLLGLARSRLLDHTPPPLRVTMRRTLRQIETRANLQRSAVRATLETALDADVLKAKEEVGLAGSSALLLGAIGTLARAAKSDASLVITGETGSGKELFARLTHRLSDRAKGPFVAINCAAIPQALLEAELFGHERGAFTGAERTRPGLFVEAEGGTLLLDELGEMSPAMQSKLLRVLEDRIVRPVGGSRSRKVNVRVVAATHRDLGALVGSGLFREDLYYRLAAITVRVPSLRERPEDVPVICNALLARDPATRGYRLDVPAMTALAEHDWPGNVRELANALRVAAALVEGSVIGRDELARAIGKASGRAPEGHKTLEETTLSALRSRHRAEVRELIGRAIAGAGGNKRRAAGALGVSRQGLYRVLGR
jgi:DNA-binding NtrC family response regulator